MIDLRFLCRYILSNTVYTFTFQPLTTYTCETATSRAVTLKRMTSAYASVRSYTSIRRYRLGVRKAYAVDVPITMAYVGVPCYTQRRTFFSVCERKIYTGFFSPIFVSCRQGEEATAVLQHQCYFNFIIKRNWRHGTTKKSKIGQEHFCRHPHTKEFRLVMKLSTVRKLYYSYATKRFTCVMHTLLIRLHTLHTRW